MLHEMLGDHMPMLHEELGYLLKLTIKMHRRMLP